MERLSECKYLKQVEVEYTKTLLTEDPVFLCPAPNFGGKETDPKA